MSYGFYSDTAEKSGVSVYLYRKYENPDEFVHVTHISNDPIAPEYKFTDKKYVGKLGEYVKVIYASYKHFGDMKGEYVMEKQWSDGDLKVERKDV